MAYKSFLFTFLGVLLTCNVYQGREVYKAQQYNPSIDFLSHESGVLQPDPKAALLNQPVQTNQHTTSSGKRDYVAPQGTISKPNPTPSASSTSHQPINSFDSDFPAIGKPQNSPSGKRDYVASNWPNLPSPQSNKGPQTSPSLPPTINPPAVTTNNGRRDYVNPNWPALPTPSKNANASLSPTTAPKLEPSSFSSVVAGGGSPDKPIGTSSLPTSVPAKPNRPIVLPSTLVNNYQHPNNNNGPTDLELQNLSEELLRKDSNNAFTIITINYQEKTTSQSKDDKAPYPFLVIPDKVWNMPTVQKFVPLIDNYEWDTLVNEYVTPQERKEENEFMDAIMSTSVIRQLMSFLKDKGYVTPDPKQQRDFLKQLWFSLYSRGKGKIGSSAFEHIFVSELKNGQVSGLHNWIYFAKQEALNRVNYLGYMKLAEFNNKGAVLKFHFTQQGYDKPVDTMFVGTSPELEMALYTVCFVTRADKDCRLKLGGKDVTIVTHTFRYRSKNLIGSAFPQI